MNKYYSENKTKECPSKYSTMRISEYIFWFVVFFWLVIYVLPDNVFAWPLSLRDVGTEAIPFLSGVSHKAPDSMVDMSESERREGEFVSIDSPCTLCGVPATNGARAAVA